MIVQVGAFPPPIGGISIFIKRTKDLLDKMDIDNEVWSNLTNEYNINNVKSVKLKTLPFYYIKNRKKIDVIHINLTGTKEKIFVSYLNFILKKNCKKLISIHGNVNDLLKDKKRCKKLIKALNRFDNIICVKTGDKNILKEMGVYTNIIEMNAFIKPINYCELPIEINEFIDKKDLIISSNASSVNEIYGIKDCVKLILDLKLKLKNKKIGLVLLIPQVDDYVKLNEIIKYIKINKLEDEILIYTGTIDFCSVIVKSNLVVRATKIDGYGVSLAEAISLNIPALASNVCQRPKGTEIYNVNNYDEFLEKAYDILENNDKYINYIKNIEIEDCFYKLKNLYFTNYKGD